MNNNIDHSNCPHAHTQLNCPDCVHYVKPRPVRIEKRDYSSAVCASGSRIAYGYRHVVEYAAIERGTGKVIWTSKRKRDVIDAMSRAGREIIK